YVPTFAVLMAPLSLVPELPITWVYRAVSVLCLRYLVGSWRAVGWSLLFPPVTIELVALNLTLPIPAAGRLGLRGAPASAGGQLLFLVPSTLGDFLLRFSIAGLVTVLAVRRGWGWLAFAAATLAVPTLWLARLAPLVAVPRLWMEERRRSRAAGLPAGEAPG